MRPSSFPWLPVFLIAAGIPMGTAHAAPTGEETTPRIIELNELPLLFADDSGIASSAGVIRTVHAAKTRPAPVLEPKLPWEGSRVYVYGSVYYDQSADRLSLWYLGHPEPDASGKEPRVPGFRKGKGDVVLYATSRDGLEWERPELGLHSFQGSKANNIVFDLHSASVLHDLREKDPAKRYKMLGSRVGAYYAAVSPDGLTWQRHPDDNPILTASDNISLTQDPFTGDYLAYHRRPSTKNGRCVWLSRSADFTTWSKPELVFAADAIDNAWARNPGERTEVNNLSVFPHAAGFLGLPTIFRVLIPTRPAESLTHGQSGTDGILDVQLITSTDGTHWQRTEPRLPVIARGAPGQFDAGAILGVSSTCVHVGDETWVYYTALTTSHGAPIPPKRNAIGRAEWRRHGFVSLDAGENGRVETKPLRLHGGELIINANATGGELRVALTEADGTPIAGHSADECEVLTSDATQWRARWKGGSQPLPTDHPIRVVVTMKQARLYSISIGTKSPP
jgi:hypothetical protein